VERRSVVVANADDLPYSLQLAWGRPGDFVAMP
jgi:hypothetical protein